MSNEICVSILVLTYNHEKYISECLDSLLNQKTQYDYEIIIHDDASTDKTQEIIQEYRVRHPSIIRTIIQPSNLYQNGAKLPGVYRNYLYPIVRGRYIAYCEGDDWWSDEMKLQKQVTVMEENENCNLCLHLVRTTSEGGVPADITYPGLQVPAGWIDKGIFLKGLTDGNFFHTSSFLCRAERIQEVCANVPDFYKVSYVDDVPLLLYFGQLGGIYYIDEEMSYYRRNSCGSWTNRRAGNVDKIINSKYELIRVYELFDSYTDGKYSDICCHWINSEKIRIAEYKHDYKEMMKKQYGEFLKCRRRGYRAKVIILGILQNIKKVVLNQR